ncbi:YfhD family protein [Tuberibacillus sp. Marseille-P3662]|uniref:YfhD family protein n=1 Tax=Tuberibacillus sp. Marseille-P3662 TaxID=1965358 RepID=UPI000A1C7B5B|nr:YfhD family protein [Tuberibacillus sp. Marseille-P3662]
MGRGHKHRVNRDKNSKHLPQTPDQLKRPDGEDETLELSRELDDRYELKAKPGLDEKTELRRKDEEE